MARLRYNGLSTTLGGSGLASGATTSVTFGAALTYNGGTAVPTIAGSDYIPLSILDSTGKLAEIVYLTSYTSGATTGTITRAQEGTSGAARASGLKVVQSPTTQDVDLGRVLLKETVLAATASTISFTSSDIPTSGYRHLQLRVVARSTISGTQDNVFMALNSDTTAANYLRSRLTGVNSAVSGVSASDRGLGAVSAASASANSAGLIDVTFLNYTDTTFDKVAHGFNYNRGATTIQQLAWEWFSTSAITSLDLTCGASFAIGSRFQLYGLS